MSFNDHSPILQSDSFFLGVIEGFYGRSYSWTQRQELIEFLARQGYHSYCYAPKSQRHLRSHWQQPFLSSDLAELKKLAAHCHNHGLAFGLGFSPWGLQQSYGLEDRQALCKKIHELNGIGADWLCVLFDDMPGDGHDLADRQLRVMHDVLRYSSASRFAFCPTYYSDDPVLENLFGVRPVDYWHQLGCELPANVDVFWTGSKVISPGYHPEDFASITDQLKRKPLLWDNYPVNDGRLISNYLHLALFPNRPAGLSDALSGHIVNPMNQFYLSLLVLSALPAIYTGIHNEVDHWRDTCLRLGGESFLSMIDRDKTMFQFDGLLAIGSEQKQQLIADYLAQGSAPALEVADWLGNGYQFDPACLTD